MAIDIRKYINITSGVGGNGAVRQRDLIGRIFSTNVLLPPQSFIEFESADDVANYFGSASEEYARAAFYFGWVSKNIVSPRKISFARWADAAVEPRIYGNIQSQGVSTYSSISNGSFSLTMDGDTETFTGLDFTGATTLADVATVLQTAVRTGTGTLWTSATVTYNAARGSFDLIGGATGAADISVAAGTTGTEVAALVGWLTGAILCDGSNIETVQETLATSEEASDNFGSFAFIDALSADEALEAATWNDAQNNKFMFCLPCSAATASTLSAALIGLSGCALTLSVTAGEYPELCPMIILAATDYNKRSSVQNFMFQTFDLTPSVTTTAAATAYDALRVNYYGRTQTAGQNIDFYQRGTLMGGNTDATDQNTYANEIWLKDKAASQIMSLLMSLSRVSANDTGRAQLQTSLQAVIDLALLNGTISVGKTLNTTQKLYIGQITGDDLAWHQVQSTGYWLGVTFEQITTTDGRTEWKAVYTLVYAKDDVIRAVDGTHILI